ncbi:hypothetical protein MPSEU_000792100 [Mayamaea pseudoterrestris]|nr:hypothetical protein MPSEU_000792100 [Mayamaea pseudoterrestris]
MASASGSQNTRAARASRVDTELSTVGKPYLSTAMPIATKTTIPPTEGCVLCKQDNNYEEMLICDKCNAEYHMGCLVPPLASVPQNNWYCSNCTSYGDELDEMVAALPPQFSSLFGSIVWAQGGGGYGWWPSIVYDPRYTLGTTRAEARKYLGKRHLCYFFHCHDVPFAVLIPSKVAAWEEGLARDYHLGKGITAKGGSRRSDFVKALQIANLEAHIPVDKRIESVEAPASKDEFNQAMVSSKLIKKTTAKRSLPKGGSVRRTLAKRPSLSSQATLSTENTASGLDVTSPTKRRKTQLIESAAATTAQSTSSDGDDVACQIFVTNKQDEVGTRRGFLFVKPDITFEKLRVAINETQETELLPMEWRFVHAELGPLSMKMEAAMPVVPLIKNASSRLHGAGSGDLKKLEVSLIAFADLGAL